MLGAAGRTDEAREMAKKYEKNGDSLVLVLIYASMGDNDAAYKWLLKARERQGPMVSVADEMVPDKRVIFITTRGLSRWPRN